MPPAPNALLFIGTGCPHCAATIEGLVRLVKLGRLGRLEVVNVTVEPAAAERQGVRTVPSVRIGPFELTGALGPAELADWVDLAVAGEGWSAYFAHLLENRRMDELVDRLKKRPSTLVDLLDLLADEEIPMGIRIGVSAVIEHLEGSTLLATVRPEIEQLTLSESAQTRADACHFLGLVGDRRSIPAIRRLLDDEQPDVREIAMETLAVLGERGSASETSAV